MSVCRLDFEKVTIYTAVEVQGIMALRVSSCFKQIFSDKSLDFSYQTLFLQKCLIKENTVRFNQRLHMCMNWPEKAI